MIVDTTKQIGRYKGLDEGFDKAIAFIEDTDLSSLEAGRHEISGSDVFALVQKYTTYPEADRFMEVHSDYADIQVMVSGTEIIYFAESSEGMDEHQAYTKEKDCALYKSEMDHTAVIMRDGEFALLYPGELHKPCCTLNEACDVMKIVIKIKMA